MSIQISLLGGLGNQLFIITAMLEISNKYNIPYMLMKVHTSSCTPRETYWDTVFHKLKFRNELPPAYVIITESNYNSLEPCILQKQNIKLNGYFWSISLITTLDLNQYFCLPDELNVYVTNRMNAIRKNNPIVLSDGEII